MITMNQRRAYTEMIEIMNNIEFIKAKIPTTMIRKMYLEKDKDWNFRYDKNVTLANQNILDSTKALYSYIYINYIATDEKKRELENIYEQNSKTKYNPDNMFKNRGIKIEKQQDMDLIEVKEKKWYHKIFSFIKGILRR